MDLIMCPGHGVCMGLAGQLSEAESYHRIAKAARWWGAPNVESRTLLEFHARCSRDNMVYSLARFYAGVREQPRWRTRSAREGLERRDGHDHAVRRAGGRDAGEFPGLCGLYDAATESRRRSETAR